MQANFLRTDFSTADTHALTTLRQRLPIATGEDTKRYVGSHAEMLDTRQRRARRIIKNYASRLDIG